MVRYPSAVRLAHRKRRIASAWPSRHGGALDAPGQDPRAALAASSGSTCSDADWTGSTSITGIPAARRAGPGQRRNRGTLNADQA